MGATMAALCLVPPTPAFKVGHLYEFEPIPRRMVVYDNEGWYISFMRVSALPSFAWQRRNLMHGRRAVTIWVEGDITVNGIEVDV